MQARGKAHVDIIIRNSLSIVDRTENLIERARRLVGSGNLDDVEALEIHREIENLTDVVFGVDADCVSELFKYFDRRSFVLRARREAGRPITTAECARAFAPIISPSSRSERKAWNSTSGKHLAIHAR
jgi:hypothetical protein